MNLFSWILLIVVTVCFIAAVVRMVKHKGSNSCGGDCACCGQNCEQKKRDNSK